MTSKTIPDSWETRIQEASVILQKTPEEVTQILKDHGIEEIPAGLEMLSDEEITPFGDLRSLFCETHGVALPKLRMAMKYLRGPTNSPKTDTVSTDDYALRSKYDIKTRWEDLPTEELLINYSPSQKDNPVNKTLKKRFGNQPVVAFKPESKEVAADETINYISDPEDGYPEEDFVTVDGVPVKLYSINTLPYQVIEEDPLYPGNPLKRGRSIINRFDWTDVELEKRQFFRILIDNNFIDLNAIDRTTLRAIIKTGLLELRHDYTEAAIIFTELEKLDQLPKLKLTLDDVNDNKTQSPFNVRKYR